MSRVPRILGIGFVDDIVAELLEKFGVLALLTIMVPAVLVILVLSFLLSLGVTLPLGFLLDLVAVPPETSRTITGTIGIGGALALTFLGTVRLFRRLERVVNLVTTGEWKTNDEIRSETERARRRLARKSRLPAAELADLDARLASRSVPEGDPPTSSASSDDANPPHRRRAGR